MRRWFESLWHPPPRSSHSLDDVARKEALEIIHKREADRKDFLVNRVDYKKYNPDYKSKLSDWVSRTKAIRIILPWVIAGFCWVFLMYNFPDDRWSAIFISVIIGVIISSYLDLMVHGLWGEGVDIIIDKLGRPKRRQVIADMAKTEEDVEPIPDPIGRAPDKDSPERDSSPF